MIRLLALLVVVALAGCGGGGDDDDDDSATPPGQVITQTTAPPAESGGSTTQGDAPVDGREVFLQNCSGCHTLADAGTTGKVGPNLDEAKPSYQRALTKVRDGGGGGLGVMPKFEGTLTPDQIDALARYVSNAAGAG